MGNSAELRGERRHGDSARWAGDGRVARAGLVIVLAAAVAAVACARAAQGRATSDVMLACDPGNGGITLPPGFCASVFADSVGAPRHMVLAPNGDLFVSRRPSRADSGGVLALRDANSDGRADMRENFAKAVGTGIALANGFLYASARDAIVRFPLAAGSLRPSGAADTIVAGLPLGGHTAYNFVVVGDTIFLNIGSRTNSCQVADRQIESPGNDPCTELQSRAGIWTFDANKTGQTPADGRRFATGIRNAVALARHPRDGALYSTFHGRDQLLQNWPKLFNAQESAETPSEQLIRIDRGDDFGWPYCYHDPAQGKLVLSPEYGGNKTEVGRCASSEAPLTVFPAHWAPNAMLFYTGTQFPAEYRSGAFIAFHGSWNRAPRPQAGFKVVFVPFSGGRPSGDYRTFADNFAGDSIPLSGGARHRPTGLAQGPDGSLYVSDDVGGRIWKIQYNGGR